MLEICLEQDTKLLKESVDKLSLCFKLMLGSLLYANWTSLDSNSSFCILKKIILCKLFASLIFAISIFKKLINGKTFRECGTPVKMISYRICKDRRMTMSDSLFEIFCVIWSDNYNMTSTFLPLNAWKAAPYEHL